MEVGGLSRKSTHVYCLNEEVNNSSPCLLMRIAIAIETKQKFKILYHKINDGLDSLELITKTAVWCAFCMTNKKQNKKPN